MTTTPDRLAAAAALGLTRPMRGLLFQTSPGDPAVALVGALLAGIVLLAAWLPARRRRASIR